MSWPDDDRWRVTVHSATETEPLWVTLWRAGYAVAEFRAEGLEVLHWAGPIPREKLRELVRAFDEHNQPTEGQGGQ
jgi:hypothetical protein